MHILYMNMRYYFILNIKHGASQLYLGAKYNCEAPGEGPWRGRGLFEALEARGASNSLAPTMIKDVIISNTGQGVLDTL